MHKVNLISQADYSKHRRCSEAAVSKAVKANRISLIDGKIDPAVADMQWKRNSRARVNSQRPQATEGSASAPGTTEAPDDKQPDYLESRARREAAEAELAELELGQKRGELVRKEDVERGAYTAARAMRDGLTNCAKRLGATVAVMTEPARCAAAIETEHRNLLQTWARTMGTTDVTATQPQEAAP
jgi:hypothetical protein